jgi:hypothetical protein
MTTLLGVSTSNPMLTQITDRIPPLPILLPVLLTVWAVACTWLHGPAILAYIVLQGATSGIFALSMYRISRSHSRTPGKPLDQPGADGDSTSTDDSKRPVTTQ